MSKYVSKANGIFKMIPILAFNNGKSSFLAAILAVLTSLGFMEVDPELYQIKEVAIFTQDSKFVFENLIDSRHISSVCSTYFKEIILHTLLKKIYSSFTNIAFFQYFQMVDWFVERKIEDKISVGKEYECRITLPIGIKTIKN